MHDGGITGDGHGRVVRTHDGWAVSILRRLALPGWVIVAPRRHVAAFGELRADEAAAFADLCVQLDRAIRAQLSPAKLYMMALGDNLPHWHLLFAPISESARAAGAAGPTVLTSYPEAPDFGAACVTAAVILARLSPEPPLTAT